MVLQEAYTLSNGVNIPKVGLGTWRIADADAVQVVKDAVGIGYRHIDTAQAYQNERGVGEGIRTCGVKREELFVTTKLAAEIKSYKEAVDAIDRSLKTLGLDYIDLMLIHSPKPWREFHKDEHYFEGNREAWRALEEAYGAGKLRAIGLSNFEHVDIDNILEACTVSPMVNQILAHIGNTPFELIQYSQEKGMVVEAYSPFGHGQFLKHPPQQVVQIAQKYGVTVSQLAIRYLLQLDLLPLPRSQSPAHMQQNADVNFVIGDEDMTLLKGIEFKEYGEASIFPVFGGKLE
ncbi:MAG TPA: 2,5-diketo-D-gluconic acid reductase [Chloroflexi bacterium]|nr:2,5-diketo-D-gluconic acid reductase [Chloroflexota bacterium]HHW85750.1 aldo/keto reductase [Chloroflexota bacterium]